jgi:phosphoribosylformylglycinamidine cyclo-ligase
MLTEQITGMPDGINAGKLVLSATRTYAPVIKEILENNFSDVHGLIHCSGGGQTKCLKYLPSSMKVVKDNLFDTPPVFKLIQEASKSDDNEMLQVFNMGCRMEIYTDTQSAEKMIEVAHKYGVEAQVIGHVESSNSKELEIHLNGMIHSFG